jgi:hypothetical protein
VPPKRAARSRFVPKFGRESSRDAPAGRIGARQQQVLMCVQTELALTATDSLYEHARDNIYITWVGRSPSTVVQSMETWKACMQMRMLQNEASRKLQLQRTSQPGEAETTFSITQQKLHHRISLPVVSSSPCTFDFYLRRKLLVPCLILDLYSK